MKPFGFYGLNLDISTEAAIDGLELHELIESAHDCVRDLAFTHYITNDAITEAIAPEKRPIRHEDLTDLDRIGLIRGLCDRIEVKLMEVANA